ncbi:hypothetical protein [Candidatus Berkiella aquae]|uniref:HPt domain-containing protein n=1 Tax=Candidatus Berkiella aquae TaxID=295108 RepID=A0A0Q9YNZ3_9GAMM|nr:hypothetical protein [Candidatus Berkiella aquae]MCS5712126.1 hypothetical protein [Candidatus Berkiella aquae]
MRNTECSPLIQISFLKDLQQTFQKEVRELIDVYLIDAKRKVSALYKAVEEQNLAHFKNAARELRQRSIDVGAISFSFDCLRLEMAAQEMRLESLPYLIGILEKRFVSINEELERLKVLPLFKK